MIKADKISHAKMNILKPELKAFIPITLYLMTEKNEEVFWICD